MISRLREWGLFSLKTPRSIYAHLSGEGMELVPDVLLRMKHPALPLLVSGLNEIAVVIEFPHIM